MVILPYYCGWTVHTPDLLYFTHFEDRILFTKSYETHGLVGRGGWVVVTLVSGVSQGRETQPKGWLRGGRGSKKEKGFDSQCSVSVTTHLSGLGTGKRGS